MSFLKKKWVSIVAEVSSNHCNDFSKATSLIRSAASIGVDAVKFQAYTPDSLTIPVNNKYFQIFHPKWGGQTLYDLYKNACTPLKWMKELKKISDDLGLIFLCTSFDKRTVDILEEINICAHKISSFELVDLQLIKYVSSTKKPLILSTGMSELSEIIDAVDISLQNGVKDIILLKCTSSYPADPSDINLKTIPHLKKMFNCEIGISDHTEGIGVAVASVSFGVCLIEKHFILSKEDKSPDSFFSMDVKEMSNLVESVRVAKKAVGIIHYGVSESERGNTVFRRSIFSIKNIKKGEKFTKENVAVIRPGYGLKPKYLDFILGKISKKNILKGTPIKFEFVL